MTRTIASASQTELEIIRLVGEVGRELAHEAINFDWSLATLAAVAYQRGLIAGVSSARERAKEPKP